MILDSIDNCARYAGLSPLFKKAFEHLRQTDFEKLVPGKYEIAGDDLFVIVMDYESKDASECVMESHRKYIDIQYMVSGEELIGISMLNGQVETTPYDDVKDAAFYKKEYEFVFNLKQKQFAIFHPQDLHMPCIKPPGGSFVRKAVYKVRVI
jgi:YhcH/YjgK/YiaL family protein